MDLGYCLRCLNCLIISYRHTVISRISWIIFAHFSVLSGALWGSGNRFFYPTIDFQSLFRAKLTDLVSLLLYRLLVTTYADISVRHSCPV